MIINQEYKHYEVVEYDITKGFSEIYGMSEPKNFRKRIEDILPVIQ